MSPELQACRDLATFYLPPDCPEADELAAGIMRYVHFWMEEKQEDAEAERQSALDRAWGI